MPDKSNSVGPRVLLKRLRDLMTEDMGAQERLDRIVFEIAAKMVCRFARSMCCAQTACWSFMRHRALKKRRSTVRN